MVKPKAAVAQNTVKLEKKGDIVIVYNRTCSGRLVAEGKAKLLRLIQRNPWPDEDLWEVEFENDEYGAKFQRWI